MSTHAPHRQAMLRFGPLHNSSLFSNHWLEVRLPLEPEWNERRDEARQVLERLAALWRVQRKRVEAYGDEQGLEQAFIQPVLAEIGWKLKYQTHLQGRKPDYALFADDNALDAALAVDRLSSDFWKYPTLVADAKAWHVRLDRPSRVNNQREYPPQQIEWYLDRSRLDFGILTNGRLWRLIPREHGPQQRRFQTYLEFDLPALLDAWIAPDVQLFEREPLLEEFLGFYLFFSPVAFETPDGRKPLIRRARDGSSEYSLGVGEGLREQAFEALRLCIEGFLTFKPNGLTVADDMHRCRRQSFILLYRLLFIMYAEDRGLLPYRVNATYTANRSLGHHRDEVAARLDHIHDEREPDYSRESTALWADMLDLFDLIERGHRSYGVPAYNGGLFDPDTHSFLAENGKALPDWYLARVIDQLGRAADPTSPQAGRFRVDYRDLAIQHLGGIYEGMLELQPHHAGEKMVVVSRRVQGRVEERIIRAADLVPAGYQLTDLSYRRGSVYLQTEKGERRASGSYYTPDHIVRYIIEQTLGPLCRSISVELEREIQETENQIGQASSEERQRLEDRLEALRRNFDDRVLRLRVLDPAMGSGHFLLRACHHLAEEIATHPFSADDRLAADAGDESAILFWKRRVVENCLYGVDLNELAVELAKLALWLETVAHNQPLTFLDHHLRHGNSLIGARIGVMGRLPGEAEETEDGFVRQVESNLSPLLKPLARIRSAPSDTLDQIKTKGRLYREFEQAREPFRAVAELWTTTFTGREDERPSSIQYQRALAFRGERARFRRIAAEPWFRSLLDRARRDDLAGCHWELEFPEVFFHDTGRRADAGFDGIIGNPPYDVLSEAETGRDLTTLRNFVAFDAACRPSLRGKNNLYKLFICRSLDLLAPGGYLGFITPMAVLGDDQAAEIRRAIIRAGAFTTIDAFPQKDNARLRVFPDAKLSTAVFVIRKSNSDDELRAPFTCRIHPGRELEAASASLTLTTDAVPLYDPLNLTIVSCAQADWDLATRIMKTGRLTRLKEFAEFFQGEVNETNERKRGNLIDDPNAGKLVTRGASICLYVVRPASQGRDLYLNVETFLADRSPDSKAFHHRHPRIGLQESCPQNNFRRIIAAYVPAGEFCNHKVNYCPEHKCSLDLRFLLALLNSKLADWYFRLGSTNAAVSHYQLYNLPCPIFAPRESEWPDPTAARALEALNSRDPQAAFDLLRPALETPPFPPAVLDTVTAAVDQIQAIETARGQIPRTARSALAPEAQPYQDLIDRLLYAMAGLDRSESLTLEARLATML